MRNWKKNTSEKLEEELRAVSFGFDMPAKPVFPGDTGIPPRKLRKQDFLSIVDMDESTWKLENVRVVLTRLREEDLIKFSLREETNAVTETLEQVETRNFTVPAIVFVCMLLL